MLTATPAGLKPATTRALPVAGPRFPPFPLLAAHFGIALWWALLGGAGLIWLAPTLAGGTFLDPRVLALTHTITLGFVTTIIMGVLYQIYPAMLGVGYRSERVAWWSLTAQTAGTALLVSGLLLGRGGLLGWGWTLLFGATFGVAWNVLPLRRRAARNREVAGYVSYAHTAFGFAMAIGGARIGDALGWWTTPRLELIAAHVQFAVVGFGGLTAMGIGSQMIPMFFGSPAPAGWRLKWIPRIVLTGTVLFGAGAVWRIRPAAWAGAAAMTLGTVLFLQLCHRWSRGGRAGGSDPTLRMITTALGSLAAALPLGWAALATGLSQTGLQLAYPALLLLGWLAGLILGVSYRILPSLTWAYRFGDRTREPGIPTMSDLLSPRLGLAGAWLHAAGILALITGLVFGIGSVAQLGAAFLFSAVLATVVHHLRLARTSRSTS